MRELDDTLVETADYHHSSQSLADAAYNAIERQLIRGDIRPGVIISEALLSRSIGIGRTPVREALQRLVRERLVTIIPRKGAIVSAIDISKYLRSIEIRREIERCIIGIVTQDACLREREMLFSLADKMKQAVADSNLEAALEVDGQFKQLMLTVCNNPFLKRAVRPLHAIARRFYFAQSRKPISQVAFANASLMEQIGRGDVAAAQLAGDRVMDAIEHFALKVRARGHDKVDLADWESSQATTHVTQSLSTSAYMQMVNWIVSGRFSTGEMLNEGKLCEELGLGRTPVREALQRLADDSLVTIQPRSGVRVVDFARIDLALLVEARRPLESLLARLAARRATPRMRDELRRIGEKWLVAASQRDHTTIIRLDGEMKLLITQAANDAFLGDAIEPIHSVARGLYFHYQTMTDTDVARAQVAVLKAIAEGEETDAALKARRFVTETVRAIRGSSWRDRKIF